LRARPSLALSSRRSFVRSEASNVRNTGLLGNHQLALTAPREVQAMKIQDAMTTEVKTARPEMSLKDVAAILAEHRISGLPVVDEEGQVLGVISEADILVKERAEVPYRGLRALLHHREVAAVATKVEARTAGEAMSSPAVTTEPFWSLADAAMLMTE